MSEDAKTTIVLIAVASFFMALAAFFFTDTLGRERTGPQLVLVDSSFIDTSPVRMNFAALDRMDGDTSDYMCYACHDRGERIELAFDSVGRVIVDEHDYITFKHGDILDTNHCFTCHDPDQMNSLMTRSGQTLSFNESNLLCASCHGSTYRDWNNDVHGRTSGYWNIAMGERKRLDCTECHDPHNPGFPRLAPAPGPHSMKGRTILTPRSEEE